MEVIFEIRFETTLPSDAIFGIVYNEFKDEYESVEQLPILQLPAAMRSGDPNLRFAPHYKIKEGNFIIHIGPNVFGLVNVNEYCGWSIFSEKISETCSKIAKLNIIKKLLRTALRYINIFPDLNIFDKSNLDIKLNNQPFSKNPINLIAEIPFQDGAGASDLRLLNKGETVAIKEKVQRGSIIDIDTYVGDKDFSTLKDTVELIHHEEKKLFFSLLKDEFLSSLNPKYEVV